MTSSRRGGVGRSGAGLAARRGVAWRGEGVRCVRSTGRGEGVDSGGLGGEVAGDRTSREVPLRDCVKACFRFGVIRGVFACFFCFAISLSLERDLRHAPFS
jgi:hypothetical protein